MKRILTTLFVTILMCGFCIGVIAVEPQLGGDGHSTAFLKPDGTFWTNYNQKQNFYKRANDVKWIFNGGEGLLLKNDNSLWSWGNNTHGTIGNGTNFKDVTNPVKIMDDVVFATGNDISRAVIKADGTLWMWGSNIAGCLGIGNREKQNSPIEVANDVTYVTLGDYTTGFVKKDNSFWIMGFSQSTDPDEDILFPTKIMDGVKDAKFGRNVFLVRKVDNSLWGWTQWKKDPIKIIDNVISYEIGESISTGYSIAAITSDNKCWGASNNINEIVHIADDVKMLRFSDANVFFYLTNSGHLFNGVFGSKIYTNKMFDNVTSFNANYPLGVRFIRNDGFIYSDDSMLSYVEKIKVPYGNNSNMTIYKNVPITTFGLSGSSKIETGQSAIITAIYYDEKGNQILDPNVAWYFDQNGVINATINNNVLFVDAVKPGTARISAYHNPTGAVAEFYIEVTEKPIYVELDGLSVTFDQMPIIKDDRVMVPLRKIFENLGYTVEWDGNTQTATAKRGDDYIIVQIGNNNILYRLGTTTGTFTNDVSPFIIGSRTLVPVRAIAQCAGCDVKWDAETYTVYLYNKK